MKISMQGGGRREEHEITIDGEEMEPVTEFCYLGSLT